MTNPQLLEYIKQQLATNVNKEIIKSNLIAGGGWSVKDIDEAFSSLTISQSPEIHTEVPKNKSHKAILLILVILIILGSVAWAYTYFVGSKDSNIQTVSEPDTSSPEASSTQVIMTEQKTSTIKFNETILSFSYPSDWYLYRDNSNNASRVYLVKDSSDLEGSFFNEIESKQKTHIAIGLYTDAYTTELIKRFYNPIEMEANKKLKNAFGETLIWFLGKDIENWGSAKDDLISSYVLLLPYVKDQPRTIFASLRPYNDKETNDISTIEQIVSSFKIVETRDSTSDNLPLQTYKFSTTYPTKTIKLKLSHHPIEINSAWGTETTYTGNDDGSLGQYTFENGTKMTVTLNKLSPLDELKQSNMPPPAKAEFDSVFEFIASKIGEDFSGYDYELFLLETTPQTINDAITPQDKEGYSKVLFLKDVTLFLQSETVLKYTTNYGKGFVRIFLNNDRPHTVDFYDQNEWRYSFGFSAQQNVTKAEVDALITSIKPI